MNVISLPTAATSYIEVRRRGRRWLIHLSTPAGIKTLRTTLAEAETYEAAEVWANTAGRDLKWPVRLPKHNRGKRHGR